MMNGKYGTFTDEQLKSYSKKLHSKVHWLLIYKENQTFSGFNEYCEYLLKYINSLNKIVGDNSKIVDLMVMVQMAYSEASSDEFDFKSFRRYVLDAHKIIDELWG